jgi:hypothetical protein
MTVAEQMEIRKTLKETRLALAEVKSRLAASAFERELKYEASQPRAARGTSTGGQWVGSGGASGTRTRASPPPPRPRSPAPPTLGRLPHPSLRTPLPVIAGGVAVQRAAGTYASEVSGQPKTPFLHIPYSTPTVGPPWASRPSHSPTLNGGPLGRGRPRVSRARRERGSTDRQCEAQFELDRGLCSQTSIQYGRTGADRRAIYKICEGTAAERHAECRAGGGIHAIRTPLYNGRHYKGG